MRSPLLETWQRLGSKKKKDYVFEEAGPFCPQCGESDLACTGCYANGYGYECRCCGQHFLADREQKDNE